MSSTPRMTCSDHHGTPSSKAGAPSAAAAKLATPSPHRQSTPVVPPAAALKRMIESETAEETALVRRGEGAAVMRINHLKATNAAHERNLALLTHSLSAQHELLADVGARMAALSKMLPKNPRELAESRVDIEAVAREVHSMHLRLSRGSQPSSMGSGPRRAAPTTPAAAAPASARPTPSSSRPTPASPASPERATARPEVVIS